MEGDTIYKERFVDKIMLAIFAPLVLFMLFITIYQLTIGPFGDRPGPTLLFIVLFIIFLVLGMNFSIFSVQVDYHQVSVGYGAIKHKEQFENIENICVDETPGIKYGGWGIRIAKIKGKKKLAFITIGSPKCALVLREGKYNEFVFSTRNPEEVVNVVKGQLVLALGT